MAGKNIESQKGLAKTAHRVYGAKTQHLTCECGGKIFVILLFGNGKLIPRAECENCHQTARKPKQLFKLV